jgi:restriction system protein
MLEVIGDAKAPMKRNPQSPWNPLEPASPTPAEYEQQVLRWLKQTSKDFETFEAVHQGSMTGPGGKYVFDVLVNISTFKGALVVVAVECKHQKRPVERKEVIILERKIRDVGAHKGMLFSTSGFQKGALKYASAHGVATITFAAGRFAYETRGLYGPPDPPAWERIHQFVGLRLASRERRIECHAIYEDDVDAIREWLLGT